MGPEAFSRDEAEIPNVTVLFPLISFAKPKTEARKQGSQGASPERSVLRVQGRPEKIWRSKRKYPQKTSTKVELASRFFSL